MAEPKSQRARQPISRHPLFAAIVALWFAALLGLGSLVMSVSALEGIVLASHIDSLVPAAAPPLGLTARLALALGLGGLGAVIGWVLARRIGRPKVVASPHVFKVADVDLAGAQWPGVADPDDCPRLAPAEPDDCPIFAEAEPMAPEALAEIAAPVFVPEIEEALPAPVATDRAQPPLTAAQRIAAADLDTLSHVELVERLAIALKRRQELRGAATEEAPESADSVIRFPDFADRRGARLAPPAAQSYPAPQETEKALRAALAQLQRISGGA